MRGRSRSVKTSELNLDSTLNKDQDQDQAPYCIMTYLPPILIPNPYQHLHHNHHCCRCHGLVQQHVGSRVLIKWSSGSMGVMRMEKCEVGRMEEQGRKSFSQRVVSKGEYIGL